MGASSLLGFLELDRAGIQRQSAMSGSILHAVYPDSDPLRRKSAVPNSLMSLFDVEIALDPKSCESLNHLPSAPRLGDERPRSTGIEVVPA